MRSQTMKRCTLTLTCTPRTHVPDSVAQSCPFCLAHLSGSPLPTTRVYSPTSIPRAYLPCPVPQGTLNSQGPLPGPTLW